jgi:hypothetical protein
MHSSAARRLAARLDNTRLFFRLDDDGNPADYGAYEQVGSAAWL